MLLLPCPDLPSYVSGYGWGREDVPLENDSGEIKLGTQKSPTGAQEPGLWARVPQVPGPQPVKQYLSRK